MCSRELTEQLARHLAARDQGAVLLVCVLKYVGGQSLLLRIGLVQPSASARQLMELVDLHLETVVLADEVAHVEIRAAVVGRLGERQGELFADRWPTDPHQLAVLVNRLSSRLGYEQVVRPQLRASPRAGARGAVCAGDGARSEESRSQGARARTPRSLSPLSPCSPSSAAALPRAAADRSASASPRTGRRNSCGSTRGASGSSQHWGPERIETLWWRGPSVRRDYYRIATESGSQQWIFRRLADGRVVPAWDLCVRGRRLQAHVVICNYPSGL